MVRYPKTALALLLVCLVPGFGFGDSAKKLYQEGKEAEDRGDILGAYLYYTQAEAASHRNKKYRGAAQAVKTNALLQAVANRKPAASTTSINPGDPNLDHAP